MDKIILYKAHDSNDILEYLTYKDDFIDEKARSFIVDNVETILKNLKYCDEKRKVLKQIEDDINKLTDILCLWIRTINAVKIAYIPLIIHRFNPHQLIVLFFIEIGRKILKFV